MSKYLLKTVSTIIGLLLIGIVGTTYARSASPETKTSAKRQVKLEGQPNTRDLGGYSTVDGRRVKWGQVYRAGELSHLTDADVNRLRELKLATVVSFLTPAEIDVRRNDRLPTGVKEIALPILGGNLGDMTEDVNEARRTGDFSKVPPELNPFFHQALIRDATSEYASLLRELIDPANRPLVFHCSHGIHRTGTATAILLSALGVPWETISEDYLLSNDYRHETIQKRLEQLKSEAAKTLNIQESEVDMANMEAFYILEAEYIDAALEEAINTYGSMENYIRKGLGLSDAEVKSLQLQLLE